MSFYPIGDGALAAAKPIIFEITFFKKMVRLLSMTTFFPIQFSFVINCFNSCAYLSYLASVCLLLQRRVTMSTPIKTSSSTTSTGSPRTVSCSSGSLNGEDIIEKLRSTREDVFIKLARMHLLFNIDAVGDTLASLFDEKTKDCDGNFFRLTVQSVTF